MTPADLRAWRASLKLSRAGLGALLGVSGRTVEAWERGVYPMPERWDKLIRYIQCEQSTASPPTVKTS